MDLARVAKRLSKKAGTMDTINVIIEIPRGSQNKYEYDHENHTIKLDRHLIVSMGYPAEYGFIPRPWAVTATRWTRWCSPNTRHSPAVSSSPRSWACA